MIINHTIKYQNNNISDFIYMSDSVFLPAILGAKYESILNKLFMSRGNLYSYKNTISVIEDNKIIGLCWYYKSNRNNMLSVLTYMGIFILNPLIAIKLITIKRNSLTSDLNNSGIYILAIAIDEKYRGQGVGKTILLEIETIARKKNIKIIELDVENRNTKAIDFYLKNGFHSVFSHEFIQGVFKTVYIRMQKSI